MEPRGRTQNHYQSYQGKFQAIWTFSKSPYNHIPFLRKEGQFLAEVQYAAATAPAVIYEADYII